MAKLCKKEKKTVKNLDEAQKFLHIAILKDAYY